jgi:RNA 3'-terminal phosphate cyclase
LHLGRRGNDHVSPTSFKNITWQPTNTMADERDIDATSVAWVDPKDYAFTIDGSVGESGGQMGRLIPWLAAFVIESGAGAGVAPRKFTMTKYRHSRPTPGLAFQHKLGIGESMESLGFSPAFPLEIKMTKFSFINGRRPINTSANININIGCRTAGAITLILQSLLPRAALCRGVFSANITGGTDTGFSPPVDYARHILFPILESLFPTKKFGMDVISRGIYPRGGGKVIVNVSPNFQEPCGPSPSWDVKGDIAFFEAHVWGDNTLLDEQVLSEAKSLIQSVFLMDACPDVKVFSSHMSHFSEWLGHPRQKGETRVAPDEGPTAPPQDAPTLTKTEQQHAAGPPTKSTHVAAGILLVAVTDSGHRIAVDHRRSPKENPDMTASEMLAEVVTSLKTQWDRSGCFDEHAEDQILPFLVFRAVQTKEPFSVLFGKNMTSHTLTCLRILSAAQMFTNIDTFVEKISSGPYEGLHMLNVVNNNGSD